MDQEYSIKAKIEIDKEHVNKEVLIINSYENAIGKTDAAENNEQEIKENIQIFIEEQPINFAYKHKFDKEGPYLIVYKLKKKLTKINYLFNGCEVLTELDFSDFNTEDVTKMNRMFHECSKIKALNLSYFNTKKVIDMSYMFYQCSSLEELNLENFTTQTETDVKNMFGYCSKLKKEKLETNDKKIIEEYERNH